MAKIFITGGTGFTGPHTVKALIARGHQVVGLCRSDASAQVMKNLGGEVVRGDIASLDVLKEQAEKADGVIHMAFHLDPSSFDFAASAALDAAAVDTICDALAGTGKVFINTGGTLYCALPLGSEPADETYQGTDLSYPLNLRGDSFVRALSYKDKGVKSMAIRLSPTVHGEGDRGFIPAWINISKSLGYVPYFGDGDSQWTAVHKADAGLLYALAFENPEAGAIWHGAAENLKLKDIAEVIAKKLSLKTKSLSYDESPAEMGPLAILLKLNAPCKTDITVSKLGWKPTHNTLFEDIELY